MMREIEQNITELEWGVIVHGCNCSGGFGSGVAGAIKEKWPIVAKVFHATPPCPELLGGIQVVRIQEELFVINAFTQINYGSDGLRYADPMAIQETLKSAIRFATKTNLDLYVPRIGCGLGGLSWEKEVKPLFETLALDARDHDVWFNVCTI